MMSQVSAESKYSAKYIKPSKVKAEFVVEGTKIRISSEAQEAVYEYLDNAVAKAVKELIGKLPKVSKGANKGSLKRITIKKEDVLDPPSTTEEDQKED